MTFVFGFTSGTHGTCAHLSQWPPEYGTPTGIGFGSSTIAGGGAGGAVFAGGNVDPDAKPVAFGAGPVGAGNCAKATVSTARQAATAQRIFVDIRFPLPAHLN